MLTILVHIVCEPFCEPHRTLNSLQMKSTSKYHVPANLLLAAKNEMNSILERMNLQWGQINQQPTGNRNLVNSSKTQTAFLLLFYDYCS